jgi:hypothetical protein
MAAGNFGFPPGETPPFIYTTFSHYSDISAALGGSPARAHNLGCGVITLGPVACRKADWTPAKQAAFNQKFLKVLHAFAWEQKWMKPPGLAMAVVWPGTHYYLHGAGFSKILSFTNPIHANPPAPLELWTLSLDIPELIADMKTIWEWRGEQLATRRLHGPCGPLHFTFHPPEPVF